MTASFGIAAYDGVAIAAHALVARADAALYAEKHAGQVRARV